MEWTFSVNWEWETIDGQIFVQAAHLLDELHRLAEEAVEFPNAAAILLALADCTAQIGIEP